jgi:ubiquinone/menaquinone biosynthesis C-methylase UbiE
MRYLLLLLAALHTAAAQTPAPAAAAPPPELTEYMGRTIAKTMHWTGAEWLMRQNREQEENAALMLEKLAIQKGWTICDLGCGNGYHALQMAASTGEAGTVYAVDIQQQMLDMLTARAAGRGIKNIKPILGLPWDPQLPPASCDLILLVDVYHEFGHPEQMLTAMHKALKPGGMVALVEFRTEDPRVPIKPEHKMTRAQIYREWQAGGFRVAREFHGLPWQHLVWLRHAKDGEPAVEPPVVEQFGPALAEMVPPAERFRRGVQLYFEGKIKECLVEWDAQVKDDPSSLPGHWQRGLALYYAGRWQDGRTQFEVHQTVNPQDVENAVWHYLCVARLENVAAAQKAFIPITADPRVPMREIHALFAGKGTPEAVLASAAKSDGHTPEAVQSHLCYANLYLGLYFEAAGKTDEAKKHMLEAARLTDDESYMGRTAKVHCTVRGWQQP